MALSPTRSGVDCFEKSRDKQVGVKYTSRMTDVSFVNRGSRDGSGDLSLSFRVEDPVLSRDYYRGRNVDRSQPRS